MFDAKCEELADAFLEGDPELDVINTNENSAELAQRIQDTIEDFISEKRRAA